MFSKESQRRGGHVVVVAVHADVTGLGQDVGSGGSSSSATGRCGWLVLLDGALLDEQVQVTAHRGRRQPQAAGQGGSGERAIRGDRLSDPVPGACLEHVRCGTGPCLLYTSDAADEEDSVDLGGR